METKLLMMICVSVMVGTSVPAGFHLGVMNTLADHLRDWLRDVFLERYNVTMGPEDLSLMWSLIISIFLVGGSFGSFIGSWMADKLGRKMPLVISSGMYTVGAILFFCCDYARSVEMLLLARLIVGLASGLASSTGPMYLSEISPLNLRGTVATFYSMGIVLGIFIGQLCSLEETLGTAQLWRYSVCFFMVFIVSFLMTYPWFPESPKYLYVIVGKVNEAKESIRKLRGDKATNELIDEEMNAMKVEASEEKSSPSMWKVLTDPALRMPIILVIVMQGGQQFAGINAFDSYSVLVYESAGVEPIRAKWATVATGFISFFTISFSPLTMHKFNRRPVILYSCCHCCFFLICLIIAISCSHLAWWVPYTTCAAVTGFLIGFEIGFGTLSLFIGSELFESSPRSAAMAVGSVCYWSGNLVVALSFPTTHLHWGAFSFVPCAFMCMFMFLFLWFYLPETRNKHASDVAPLISQGFASRPRRALKNDCDVLER